MIFYAEHMWVAYYGETIQKGPNVESNPYR